jgi:hypothetical protein
MLKWLLSQVKSLLSLEYAHDPLTLGTANGLSLSGQVLSLGLASATTTGALSSSDFATFSGKLNLTSLLAGFVAGSGTVTSADSILSAFEKLQGTNTAQDGIISSLITGLATTNAYLSTATGDIFSLSNTVSSLSGNLNTTNNTLTSLSGNLNTTNNNLTLSQNLNTPQVLSMLPMQTCDYPLRCSRCYQCKSCNDQWLPRNGYRRYPFSLELPRHRYRKYLLSLRSTQ